jgi:hypothetical protein
MHFALCHCCTKAAILLYCCKKQISQKKIPHFCNIDLKKNCYSPEISGTHPVEYVYRFHTVLRITKRKGGYVVSLQKNQVAGLKLVSYGLRFGLSTSSFSLERLVHQLNNGCVDFTWVNR